MSPDPKYRVALIGGGRAGPTRAWAFGCHPLCQVVAVADTDPENLELTSTRFGAAAYPTFADMFAVEQLDIVLSVLPVQHNAAAVVAAAEAGARAIFCEKPLTARLSEADRMVEACSSRGIPLGCGLMVSSHPDYRRAYAMATDGTIGQVGRINLYGKNNQGGCHGMNLVRKFAGKAAIEEVVGRVSGDPHSDHEEPYDNAKTGYGDVGGYIRFANGIEAFLGLGDFGIRGIEVVGTRGTIVNSDNTGLGMEVRLAPEGEGRVSLAELRAVDLGFAARGTGTEGDFEESGWRYPGDIMLSIAGDFIRVLEEGGELEITTGDDLRHALEMSIAVRESARRGKAPIALPLEDRSLVMYPQRSRWHYKKPLLGREEYMSALAGQKRQD